MGASSSSEQEFNYGLDSSRHADGGNAARPASTTTTTPTTNNDDIIEEVDERKLETSEFGATRDATAGSSVVFVQQQENPSAS